MQAAAASRRCTRDSTISYALAWVSVLAHRHLVTAATVSRSSPMQAPAWQSFATLGGMPRAIRLRRLLDEGGYYLTDDPIAAVRRAAGAKGSRDALAAALSTVTRHSALGNVETVQASSRWMDRSSS